MTLQQIKYIISVADEASISKAANKLYVSQPRLSNAIHEVEEELGFKIFERSSRGVTVTLEGLEFLGYARQVMWQSDILEERYFSTSDKKLYFSVSSHHYLFATHAFIQFVKKYSEYDYEFTLNETSTFNIIMDVRQRRSEIGILYLDSENEKIIKKILKEKELIFSELFVSETYVYFTDNHPLAKKKEVCLEDLQEYPCVVMEQGEHNESYFSEHALSLLNRKRTIKATDIATAIKLEKSLNAYMIGLDVSPNIFSDDPVVSRPIKPERYMTLGMIKRREEPLSAFGREYIELLKSMLCELNTK